MACRFEYQGKSYTQDQLVGALRDMTPAEAAKYIPGVKPVPEAPFQKTWHELALKRALREAAEKGYDRLSWTPGEAQAARYDLSKQVDKIAVPSVTEGSRSVRIDGKNGDSFKLTVDKAGKVQGHYSAAQFDGKPLSDVVGKEMADKIMKLDAPHEFAGEGLRIGGEGMKGFYDQIIPKALEKIGKQHGVKVKRGSLGEGLLEAGKALRDFEAQFGSRPIPADRKAEWNRLRDAVAKAKNGEKPEPIYYIDIPQSLRDEAMKKGFALFEDSAFAGAPMSALERMNDPFFKINAIRKRGQGIPTGKSAKGWDFKRPEPKKGSFAEAAAKARAGWNHDKGGILADFNEAVNPYMSPEDWEFMRSGNFRKDGGRIPHMADGGVPEFDPSAPFDTAPAFDPNKPFEPVQTDRGAVDAAKRGAYQGVTFNFGDELRGLGEAGGVKPDEWNNPVATARGAYRYWTGEPDAEKAYDEAVRREREADKQAAEQHPIAYHGAEIAGALPTMMIPGGGAARGATLAARTGQAAKAGAIYGGIAGAGEGEDAASRLTGAAVGTGLGGAGGALAPGASDLIGYGFKKTLGPAWNSVVGMFRGSENEAARRITTAALADAEDIAAGKMKGMTLQEWAAARAAGEPVALADLGGARVQSLLRSAANTSPEARGTLEKAIGDRFEGQAERVGRDVRNLVNGGANANKTADQLVAEYDLARVPAYRAAFGRPGAQAMWDQDYAQMANAPVVQQAIRMATVNGRNEAAKLGLKPPVNPFQFNKDGTVALTDPNFTPNLQFWDVVKKNLDQMGADGQAWSRTLRGKLDEAVPEYANARGIAAQFFGERDALEAGRKLAGKRVDPDVVRGLMRKMSPEERDLFREGHASDWAGRVIGNFADSRDITKAMFNSPNERKMAEVIYGPAGLKKLEARMTLERVMDGARQAMGNSTTARQLIEAGLAGGALAGFESGWDPYKMAAGAGAAGAARKALGSQMAAGARHLIGKVDAKTAARVADLLTSNDPRKLAQGMRIMVSNKRVADGMRAIADRLGNAAQSRGPRLQIDTTGWGGARPALAEPDQQQDNPGWQ